MTVTLLGMVTEVRPVHFLNAELPMDVTEKVIPYAGNALGDTDVPGILVVPMCYCYRHRIISKIVINTIDHYIIRHAAKVGQQQTKKK